LALTDRRARNLARTGKNGIVYDIGPNQLPGFGLRITATRKSLLAMLSLAIVTAAPGQSCAANPTLITLVSFNGANGSTPAAGLVADAYGNLFGTTFEGGPSFQGGSTGDGTVFEITKTPGGYDSTPTTLASFNGANGRYPAAALIADANGNLFGTTERGGAYGYFDGVNGYGTVFKIAKTARGYDSTAITLASFNGTNGVFPGGRLIADANGNLFSTTGAGGVGFAPPGSLGNGTVFEIAKTARGYDSTPITLASFNGGSNGATPLSGLIADARGSFLGTAANGGVYGNGTVFKIAKTARGYDSTPITVANFNGSNGGAAPVAGLIADAHGNLFGTTVAFGAFGYGTVFEIAKTARGYDSTPITVANFNGTNGANSQADLIADANGNLFGTTLEGWGVRVRHGV
jgi:hypothetical protein